MILELFLFIISLILMPFVVHESSWRVKTIYLCLCTVLTPMVGVPVYKMLGGR